MYHDRTFENSTKGPVCIFLPLHPNFTGHMDHTLPALSASLESISISDIPRLFLIPTSVDRLCPRVWNVV